MSDNQNLKNQIKWNDDVIIKQFISYAIGVYMGRYCLDKSGLHIAHPAPTEEEIASYEYKNMIVSIDDDGIIPLMSNDAPFIDNAPKRISELVRIVFGSELHAQNMNFIEASLKKSLDDYLRKDFYKDHTSMYQKRPIYWLFSSKKGAFQVLTYMHRMDRYTVEKIRQRYLLPYIEYLRNTLGDFERRAASLSPAERKAQERVKKEYEECIEYHEQLHAIADMQIDFDLDDGVVVNYAKFGGVLAKIK